TGGDGHVALAEHHALRHRHVLAFDAVLIDHVMLEGEIDLVDARFDGWVECAGSTDDDDSVVVTGIQCPSERIRRLDLSWSSDQAIEPGDVSGERDEFGLKGGDEKFHGSILTERRCILCL